LSSRGDLGERGGGRIVERRVVLQERPGDEEARRVYREGCIRVPAGELLPDGLDLGEVGGNSPAVPCLPGSATVSSTRASLRPMMTALPPPATTPAAVPLIMPLLPPATTTLQPSKLPVIPGSPPMAESPGFSRVLRRPLAGVALESGPVAGGRRGARGSGGA